MAGYTAKYKDWIYNRDTRTGYTARISGEGTQEGFQDWLHSKKTKAGYTHIKNTSWVHSISSIARTRYKGRYPGLYIQ
jgi:hypothetical protein